MIPLPRVPLPFGVLELPVIIINDFNYFIARLLNVLLGLLFSCRFSLHCFLSGFLLDPRIATTHHPGLRLLNGKLLIEWNDNVFVLRAYAHSSYTVANTRCERVYTRIIKEKIIREIYFICVWNMHEHYYYSFSVYVLRVWLLYHCYTHYFIFNVVYGSFVPH